MTPAEARQIEREEFAAECAAIRERALAYAKDHREREVKRLSAWIRSEGTTVRARGMKAESQRTGNQKSGRAVALNAKLFSAFGQKRTLGEWAEESGISLSTIHSRLHRGWTMERALSKPQERGQNSVLYRNRSIIRRIASALTSAPQQERRS